MAKEKVRNATEEYYYLLAFPADICKMLCRPLEAGKAYRPARAGFVGDAYTPANETADGTKDRDLVSLNMSAPIRSMTDLHDNPKIINRSDVYIYNSGSFFVMVIICSILNFTVLN